MHIELGRGDGRKRVFLFKCPPSLKASIEEVSRQVQDTAGSVSTVAQVQVSESSCK